MAALPAPDEPLPLLGGLTPRQFMARHWQRRPLLVRQALPGVRPPVSRVEAFALSARDDVESRLVRQQGDRWSLRRGPLPRRALPPVAQPGWTVLVQGLDLHVPAARDLLDRFRFIPEARLDDLMLSWASDGGGVGPHLDSYDVFLIQVAGRRRWRIGPAQDRRFVPGLPLRILQHFEPTDTWVLEPGDMLYLPPGWGHDGTAVGGDCMTCSIGFRSPSAGELARELLLRLSDDEGEPGLYRDPQQPATALPGELPPALLEFAQRALLRHLADPQALPRALGEILTEPKPQVWFEGREALGTGAIVLDPRTRMAYDARHVFINGESFVAGGRDARLMRTLADTRELGARDRAALSDGAAELLGDWLGAGWAHEQGT
jgi:50S ribosomal protein L16 3-hydroxylase